MESKGKLIDVTKDWQTGKFRLTFTVDRDVSNDLDALKGDLRIKAVKWREKRSLDANAYYWQLLTQVADATNQSNTEVHNQMLSEFGTVEVMAGAAMTVILLDSVDWRKLPGLHLRPTSAAKVLDNGKLYRVYYVMKGSHEYDSKEMSRLINGLVEEAKQLGIETMTPAEIERMVALDKRFKKQADG